MGFRCPVRVKNVGGAYLYAEEGVYDPDGGHFRSEEGRGDFAWGLCDGGGDADGFFVRGDRGYWRAAFGYDDGPDAGDFYDRFARIGSAAGHRGRGIGKWWSEERRKSAARLGNRARYRSDVNAYAQLPGQFCQCE